MPQYPQRAPLKRTALPNLVAKALAALEAAPDLDAADALPAELRAQHGFPPWHQVLLAQPDAPFPVPEGGNEVVCKPCRRVDWLAALQLK